jgi:branched-chain amino acid transport system substrate-binding protein
MVNRLNRKGVSTMIAVVLLIVGLVIGAAVGYGATATTKGATSTVTTTVQQTSTSGGSALSGTINIGVLADMTDGLASEGIKINYTANQAAADINAYLANTVYAGKVKFNVIVEDYGLQAAKAESDMSTFKSDGVTVVVGPLDSGTTQDLLTFANSNQMIMISPSSTSAALAIPNDYLFRTAPTDVHQGQADAAMMWDNGVKAVIQVYRQDTYGSGLNNYTSADFKALGGTVVAQIPYDTTTTDFSPILATLNTDWNNAVGKYGADGLAIQLISFDEGATIIQQASQQYPNLVKTQQPWYGVDGEQGESAFTNSTIASAIQAVRLPSTVFGYTNSSKTIALCQQILAATHLPCDPYPLGAYDDVWIGALSILACGTNSGACVQKEITTVADNYYGVTGWTALDQNGDRAASDYLIYCITGPSSNLQWTVCGSWSYQSNQVTWINKPAT